MYGILGTHVEYFIDPSARVSINSLVRKHAVVPIVFLKVSFLLFGGIVILL